MSNCDLFNNNSGGYVNPGLAPCAGSEEDNRLEFVDKGIGIVNGSETVSVIDFSDLSIPVTSWSQQTQSLGPGEVTFIQGLSKGLTFRSQTFNLPNLTSSDDSLNPYFLEVDLSIAHYKNFAYTTSSIDTSANYAENIDIATALDQAFNAESIKALTTYDPSSLKFTSSQEGYQFDIGNVVLNVIDASQDSNSPYPAYIVAGERVQQTWILEENTAASVPYSKYPNTASQGIILKAIYPYDVNGNTLCPVDKWIYINHAKNTVDVCDPIELRFNTDVSTELVIVFDGSTYLGDKPFIADPSVADSSINDSSINGQTLVDVEFYNCDITDSSILRGVLNQGTTVSDSVINDSWANVYILVTNPSTGEKIYVMEDDTLPLDSSAWRGEINNSLVWDSSFNNMTITDTSLYRTYLQDCSLLGCTTYNCTFDDSVEADTRTIMIDASISCDPSIIYDTSTFYTKTTKTVDVGMSGCSDASTMSAGDYLNWVTVNDEWKKVGDLYAWTSAPDVSTSTNLISGFYVYNAHTYPVSIQYLIIV